MNYTAEQIISKLREVEVKISQGIKAAEAIRSIPSIIIPQASIISLKPMLIVAGFSIILAGWFFT